VSNDIQKDWLKINKMIRDLSWILYDDAYKDCNKIKEAIEKLKIFKQKLKDIIECKQ